MIQSIKRTYSFISKHPLTRQNKLAACGRWLDWQIQSRTSKLPRLKRWIDDAVLSVDPGMTGATGNLYCGLHEFEDMALLLHYYSNGGELFVDLGANVGSYTVLASKVCGVSSICIEPVPATFRSLKRNIAENKIDDRVEAHCKALGATQGEILFSIDEGPMNRVVDSSYAGQKLSVPIQSLDLILAGRRTGFWKIDVEGFERQVLDGATSSLLDESLQIVLLEGCDDSIRITMEEAGFQQSIYNPFIRELSPINTRHISGNNVWVRDSEGLRARLMNARKRTIHGVTF